MDFAQNSQEQADSSRQQCSSQSRSHLTHNNKTYLHEESSTEMLSRAGRSHQRERHFDILTLPCSSWSPVVCFRSGRPQARKSRRSSRPCLSWSPTKRACFLELSFELLPFLLLPLSPVPPCTRKSAQSRPSDAPSASPSAYPSQEGVSVKATRRTSKRKGKK